MKVSVLLLTYNEEGNLKRCLEALTWCDDVVVLDSGSTDRTQEIARASGTRLLERAFDNFAGQRNFGLDYGGLRHDWVLHLDADEIVTPNFAEKLLALEPPADIDAYRIPSKLILHEHWLRYAGLYPSYQVRLGRRNRLRFAQVGHGQREVVSPNRIGSFEEPYLHYNFSHGINRWLQKHLKYAEDEAKAITSNGEKYRFDIASLFSLHTTYRRRAIKDLAGRLPLVLRPFFRFIYIYIVRRGFLDGRDGLQYAIMLSIYESMIALHALDLLREKCMTGQGKVKPVPNNSLEPRL